MTCLKCNNPTMKNSSYCENCHPSIIQMPQIREDHDEAARRDDRWIDSPAPAEAPQDRND